MTIVADAGPLRGDETRRDRRSIRLARYDYARPGAYFVTVVAAGREWVFGEVVGGVMRLSPIGEIVRTCWAAIPDHHPSATLDAHVIMPNHIHGILILGGVGARHAVPIVDPAANPRHHATASGSDAGGDDVPDAWARHAVPLHGGGGDIGRKWASDDGAAGGSERFGRPAMGTLPTVVRSFKAASTRQVNALRVAPGSPVWQRNYYEHVIRTDESLHRIRQYIADNPLKWDLDRLNGLAKGSH
ncbi:MAG: hypothetical protein IT332_10345 [Ardenticatenales bacterium]|nr:hypothetical protein [Ardenticatenales bacterium]